MHQDQRIGLALGVLLIGACAAFFFRNETHERPHPPQLRNAQELDDRIAERSSRPYLKGIEVVEAADRARMRMVTDHGNGSESLDDDHGGSLWSPVESAGKPLNSKGSGQRGPRANLTDIESEVQELEPIPVPGGGAMSSAAASEQATGRASQPGIKLEATPADERTHVVQKGETLSSIATKRLGNPNRFHEIFEANTDQLRDANDLRSGMVLRIPEAKGDVASKSSARKTRSMTETESSILHDSTRGITPHKDATPLAHERRTPAPPTDVDEGPVTDERGAEASEPRKNQSETSHPNDESTPGRKFVPARRFTPPTRPGGPQAKVADPATSGT